MSGPCLAAEAAGPNIVFVLFDDLGWGQTNEVGVSLTGRGGRGEKGRRTGKRGELEDD